MSHSPTGYNYDSQPPHGFILFYSTVQQSGKVWNSWFIVSSCLCFRYQEIGFASGTNTLSEPAGEFFIFKARLSKIQTQLLTPDYKSVFLSFIQTVIITFKRWPINYPERIFLNSFYILSITLGQATGPDWCSKL